MNWRISVGQGWGWNTTLMQVHLCKSGIISELRISMAHLSIKKIIWSSHKCAWMGPGDRLAVRAFLFLGLVWSQYRCERHMPFIKRSKEHMKDTRKKLTCQNLTASLPISQDNVSGTLLYFLRYHPIVQQQLCSCFAEMFCLCMSLTDRAWCSDIWEAPWERIN